MKEKLAVLAMSLFLVAPWAQADTQRQKEVAARGAHVMPFDLEKTRHRFEPMDDGGLQRVIAKGAADREQIRLIQAHLREEAARFAKGDFGDPAKIHGADMPGLAELTKGASRIQVRYTALAQGGEIRYTTSDPALVHAIHRWFGAQVHDHGRHAH